MAPSRRPVEPGCASPEDLTDRQRARRDAILEAGRELFLDRGYSATSLSAVVRRSGGSMTTLYELFGNKRGLFEAILRELAEEMLAPLCSTAVAPDPRRGLETFGRRYLEAILEPRMIGLYRMMLFEAPRTAELRELFLSRPGGPVQRALAGYLARLGAEGEIEVDDAAEAAAEFLALMRGSLHQRAMGGERGVATPAAIERQVARAVKTFLYGRALRGASTPGAARRGRSAARKRGNP